MVRQPVELRFETNARSFTELEGNAVRLLAASDIPGNNGNRFRNRHLQPLLRHQRAHRIRRSFDWSDCGFAGRYIRAAQLGS